MTNATLTALLALICFMTVSALAPGIIAKVQLEIEGATFDGGKW